jgi:hypothetical protein
MDGSILLPGFAAAQGTHTSVDGMVFLGLQTADEVFVTRGDGSSELLPEPHQGPVPWRQKQNGNPSNLYSSVKEVLRAVNVLFIVERDLNRNVVVYAVDTESPLIIPPPVQTQVFWLMIPAAARSVPIRGESDDDSSDSDSDGDPPGASNLGEVYTEDLTMVERRYAYGLTTRNITYTEEEIFIKALDKQPIRVRMHADGSYYATIQIGGTDMVLNRIFICTEPGALLWPKTTEVHLEVRLTFDAPTTLTYFFRV